MQSGNKIAKFKRSEIIAAAVSIVIVVLAWYFGYRIEKNQSTDNISEFFSRSHKIENISDNLFLIQSVDSTLYGSIGSTVGYGGEVRVFTIVNQQAEIIEIFLLDHNETPSFLNKVLKKNYLSQFLDQNISSDLATIDAISGATLTSDALGEAVLQSSQKIGQKVFNIEYPPEVDPKIILGLPEFTVILLLLIAVFVNLRLIRKPKVFWWISVLISIIVIGFIKGGLITIAKIDFYLLGNLPAWQTNIYWIVLFTGVIFTTMGFGKNFYCAGVCPFGAMQECTAFIGKAKFVRRLEVFKWAQRLLALIVIVLGLLFRNPSLAGYEVFSAMFAFVGSEILFVLLAASLIVSLFVKRFWCNYLCPVGPALNFLAYIRNIIFIRNKIQKETE